MLTILLAALIGGVEKVLYKIFVHTRNHFQFTLLWLLICSVIFGFVASFSFRIPNDFFSWMLAVGSGFIWMIATFCNFKSYALIDVSLKVIISRFKIIVVLILSWLFLSESLNSSKLLGSLLVLSGVVLAAYDPRKLHAEAKGVALTFLAACMYGLALVIDKKASAAFSPALYTCMMYFIPFAFLSLRYAVVRPKTSIASNIKRDFPGAFLTALLSSTCYFLLIYSYQYIEAGTAVVILESGNVISLLAGVSILKERRRMWPKLISSALILVGAGVLALQA